MKIGTESEKLEFKKTGAERKEGIISIVAMLNKHGCGEVYFGVRNDGLPLGMDIGEKTLRDFSQAIGNHIEPKIYPRVSDVFIDEAHCIHIVFNGEETPYFAYGRAYIRVADEDKAMTSAELESHYLKKNAGRDIWDGELSRKTVDDVDEAVLQDYLERANRAGRISYKNRIEIYNPGTFPEGLKPEDFIEGDEPSVKRNPQLAQLMYYCKDIENFGTGLKRISAACKEFGVKLEFRLMKRGFAVVFYRPDEDFNPSNNPSNVALNVVKNVVLNKAEQATLACIVENCAITAEQIAMRLSKSERTVQRYLDSLQKKNVIRRIGSRKNGYWEMVNYG